MKALFKAISVLVFMLLFHGCIYESELLSEIELPLPAENHPLSITLSETSDSIFIYGETAFRYDVNTFGLNFTAIEVKFNGMSYQLENSSGNLWVTPVWNNTTDWYDLTVNFYASTGSGSIADKLKAENYVGTKTWKVRYFNIGEHNFKLYHRIKADSILQIYYINPPNTSTLFGELTKFPNKPMKVTSQHGDTLFFADSTFFGGVETYRLEITKNVGYTRYFDLYVNNEDYSRLTVTDFSADSCLVSWTSIPFKIDYKVIDTYDHLDYKKTYYQGDGHSFKDVQPRAGWGKFYYLYGRSKFSKPDSEWRLYGIVYWKDHAMF
jgi:hypothetical protein